MCYLSQGLALSRQTLRKVRLYIKTYCNCRLKLLTVMTDICIRKTSPGAKYFAVWPLDKVALSCFGTSEWPASLPVPQAWLEFEVDDMQSASDILKESGCKLLTCMQEEPWEQTVTRFLSPEGIIMAISYTPFLRQASERA